MQFLWVGLGNPGARYQHTRHNIGADVLRSLFPSLSLQESRKHNALYAKTSWQEHSVFLLFPQTYMNLSGAAVFSALKGEQISLHNMLVFHDEIELAPAQVRYKFGGGHKGHNGLRHIISLCASGEFHRIRVGVGRPADEGSSVADYVLSRYAQNEFPAQEDILSAVREFCQTKK